MSEERRELNAPAFELLFGLLEQPEPLLTGTALFDHHPRTGAALLSAGFLLADGYEAAGISQSDHDDTPLPLDWSAEQASFGYFSPVSGWVSVPHERLLRYRVDIPVVLKALTSNLSGRLNRPEPIVCDTTWNLGEVRLPGRSMNVSIWYARRLFDVVVSRSVREQAVLRQRAGSRILLTSTPASKHLDDLLPFTQVIAAQDMINEEGLAIAPATLAAYLDRMPAAASSSALQIIGDGREVRFQGKVYLFPRGEQQRRIIRLLHGSAMRGKQRISTAEILAALDLSPRGRIRDIFKGSPAWGQLLDERDGLCGFCWEDAGKEA